MTTLCFATNNAHKIEEVSQKLQDRLLLRSLRDIGCTEELPETTGTIEGNARQKALYIRDQYGIDCFADDSGLEVDALDGRPGVDSAFYSGSRDFAANVRKVLDEMTGISQRGAQFRTVIALAWKGEVHLFEGIVRGHLLTEPTGSQGFGYDPIFVPEGHSCSFAQMDVAAKNAISHRAKATEALLAFLAQA